MTPSLVSRINDVDTHKCSYTQSDSSANDSAFCSVQRASPFCHTHNRNTQLHAAPEYFLTVGAKTPIDGIDASNNRTRFCSARRNVLVRSLSHARSRVKNKRLVGCELNVLYVTTCWSILSLSHARSRVEKINVFRNHDDMSKISTTSGSNSSTFMCISMRVCVSLRSRISASFCSTLANIRSFG